MGPGKNHGGIGDTSFNSTRFVTRLMISEPNSGPMSLLLTVENMLLGCRVWDMCFCRIFIL